MPAMKHSGAFLMIRLAATVVLLLFSTLLLNILWLIALSFIKLHELFSCLILQCVRATNALSRKIAGVTWRPLIASKVILQRRLVRKKAANISGT